MIPQLQKLTNLDWHMNFLTNFFWELILLCIFPFLINFVISLFKKEKGNDLFYYIQWLEGKGYTIQNALENLDNKELLELYKKELEEENRLYKEKLKKIKELNELYKKELEIKELNELYQKYKNGNSEIEKEIKKKLEFFYYENLNKKIKNE